MSTSQYKDIIVEVSGGIGTIKVGIPSQLFCKLLLKPFSLIALKVSMPSAGTWFQRQ
jgi:hypothetical protein